MKKFITMIFVIFVLWVPAACMADQLEQVEATQPVATAVSPTTTVTSILPNPTQTSVPSVILETPAETATAVSTPVIIAPVITWQHENGDRCLQARIGREWVETGACEGETAVYSLPEQHQAELNAFVNTFSSFYADTKAGRITFNGSNRGQNAVPFTAQERMLAYWAWVVFAALESGTDPTWNQGLFWQQEEDGRCQQLNLTLTGIATALSCDNEELVELGWDMLGAEDLAQFYAWIDSLTTTNTADFNLVGSGRTPIGPDEEVAIDYFAQSLFAWLAVNSVQSADLTVEPFVKAGYFTVAGWSADSQWLAFWASSQADIDAMQPYAMPGGTLHFADTTTGDICSAETLHTETDREAAVYWQQDNQVVIVLPTGTFAGQPCGTFAPLPDFVPLPSESEPDLALSSDGRFRANSVNTTNEDWTLMVTTSIVNVQTGTEVTSLTWQHRGGLGDLGLGGLWVSPTQFLINETFMEGPLLIDVEKGVIPVKTGLPGLSLTVPGLETGHILGATAVPGQEPDTFSLIIYGSGAEAAAPPIILYHAATGIAETLPFPHVLDISTTYEWLFLFEIVNTGGYQSGSHVWGRRIADTDAKWQLVAPSASSLVWREDDSEMAFTQNENRVIRQTFPALEQVGNWHTGRYNVYPVGFSPDGRFLVVQGNLPGTWQYGLFLLER